MPTHDHLIEVALSVRQDLDRDHKAFMSLDRMKLTKRLREVSGEPTTRIKAVKSADLERALNDQGLRCYPSLIDTPTDGQVRIFRAGSEVGNLIDAVMTPSPRHDRALAEAVTKIKGNWDWDRTEASTEERPTVASAAEILRRVLPREKHLEYVRTLDDPDLATT